MATPTVSWSESDPQGSENIALGDNRIREFKTQLREVVGRDHKFSSSGQGTDWGYHLQVTLIEAADLGTGAVGFTILGSQTVSGKGELVYVDEDNNDIQLTSVGKLKLSSGRLETNTYLKSRNNAGNADLNLIKSNASDLLEFGIVAVLKDTSSLATSAAPVADEGIANKKYVDDKVAAVPAQVGLGAAVTKSAGTAYQASTDGFVTVDAAATGTANMQIDFYSDTSNPPTTLVRSVKLGNSSGNNIISLCEPVLKTYYYKVVVTNCSVNNSMRFYPLGS